MDPNDLLLPAPEPPTSLEKGVASDEALARFAIDYYNLSAITWPSRDRHGRLVPPPDEHVLDHLARSQGLADDDEALIRPGANTVAVLSELPDCDICGSPHARYDGPLNRERQGEGGAYLCAECFTERGTPALGATGYVYLMLRGELSYDIRAKCNAACAAIGKPSLFR